MGSEGTARPGFVIRKFDAVADAPEVAAILLEAREAASWSEEALRETALLPGVAAFVSARGDFISGIVIGRQVLDEAEILNLAVRKSERRRGEGRAHVQQVQQQLVEVEVKRGVFEGPEAKDGAKFVYLGGGYQAERGT